jgi:hypothetical protein
VRMRIAPVLVALVLAVGCPSPDEAGPPKPPPPIATSRLLLGAAGAPRGTFGDPTAPEFAAGFRELSQIGFDTFLPVFLTAESGESTAEPTYFLPPAALVGFDESLTCAGARNPWAAADDIRILLPGYLLAVEQPYTEALDVARI